jgi:predicted anti-sigma-YlaC factor YlaD
MRERHPREIELARLNDREDGEAVNTEVAEHLRWCAHCRSVVADYDWLQGEIAATLEVAAEVPAPPPQWWVVRERVFADQQRQNTGWRISALSSVVLAVCLMFSAFPVQGVTATALTSPPEPIVAPAPVAVAVTSVATPTPTTERVPPSTPAFMLPPTPPQTETGGLDK